MDLCLLKTGGEPVEEDSSIIVGSAVKPNCHDMLPKVAKKKMPAWKDIWPRDILELNTMAALYILNAFNCPEKQIKMKINTRSQSLIPTSRSHVSLSLKVQMSDATTMHLWLFSCASPGAAEQGNNMQIKNKIKSLISGRSLLTCIFGHSGCELNVCRFAQREKRLAQTTREASGPCIGGVVCVGVSLRRVARGAPRSGGPTLDSTLQ